MSEEDVAQARALVSRGAAQYGSNQWQEAADTFTELLLHPGLEAASMPEIHWNIGVCFAQLGNRDLAVQHFEAGGFGPAQYSEALQHVHQQEGRALFEQANAAF